MPYHRLSRDGSRRASGGTRAPPSPLVNVLTAWKLKQRHDVRAGSSENRPKLWAQSSTSVPLQAFFRDARRPQKCVTHNAPPCGRSLRRSLSQGPRVCGSTSHHSTANPARRAAAGVAQQPKGDITIDRWPTALISSKAISRAAVPEIVESAGDPHSSPNRFSNRFASGPAASLPDSRQRPAAARASSVTSGLRRGTSYRGSDQIGVPESSTRTR